MEKMAKVRDDNREETREVFVKLNTMIVDLIKGREDVEVLFVDYNQVVSDPGTHVREICDFLGSEELDLDKMIASVDERLHRNRRQ